MEFDRNGLEVLDRQACLDLVGTATVGRVGVTTRALPTILPVNFTLHDERILIRTTPGTKLEAALSDTVVAFEVDDFDALGHSGWSVVVTGVARVLDQADVPAVPIARWAGGHDERVVAITCDLVEGRRMDPAQSKSLPRQGMRHMG